MGTPALVSLTVAVKVTGTPVADGLSEEVTAVVVAGVGSKNSPLRTALAPPVFVIVISTFPKIV